MFPIILLISPSRYSFIFKFDAGLRATDVVIYSFKEMLLVLPSIFVLIGLLDVWIPKAYVMGILIKKDEIAAIYEKAEDL